MSGDELALHAVHVEAVIDAPPERVWAVLVDLPGWNVWNPTLLDVRRPAAASDDNWQPAPGMEVRMNLRLRRVKVPMRQEIRVVDAPRELTWRTRQAVPAAFDVLRTFRLEPLEGGRTRIVQYEIATGFLAKAIFAATRKNVVAGYENLARALADRV